MNFAWRRPLTHGSLLLMETLWVYALVAAIVAVTEGNSRPTIFAVGVIVIGSYAIARGLQASLLSESLLRWWGVILSVLIFYTIVRIDFFGDARLWDFTWADKLFNNTGDALSAADTAAVGIPLLWIFWLRGVVRGQQTLSFDSVVSSFAVGLLIVGLAELIAEATDAPTMVRVVGVPYIALGLLTVGLAHAARAEDEFGKSFAPTWVMGIGGSVLAIMLVALLFALLDLDTAQEILGFTARNVAYGLGWVIYIVLYPFVYIMEGVLIAMKWMLEAIGSGAQPDPQSAQEPGPPPDEIAEPNGESPLPAWARVMTRGILVGGLIAFLFYAFTKLFVRRPRRKTPAEVRESTYQEGRLTSDLGALLGSLFGFRRPGAGGVNAEPIRRLYFDMLALGARRGVERKPAETPLELQPRLGQTLGRSLPTQLTPLFEASRYGAHAPPATEVQRLQTELDGLSKS